MLDKLMLFDTTLRDGQLSPEVSFTQEQRIEIACALETAGMDVIEIVFPGMHTEDIPSTRVLVKQIHDADLCCLARMSEDDIDIAAEIISQCPFPRLHLYLDAKSIRALCETETKRQETLQKVTSMVHYARNRVAEVEFSPQDATRIKFESLAAVTEAALTGGARVINFSDTAGVSNPGQIEKLIRGMFESVPELGEAVVSLHGHNHLGCATDNALSAICAGARQIEGTINGIGPAGGNTDLVQVVDNLQTLASPLNVCVRADYAHLQALSHKIPQGPK